MITSDHLKTSRGFTLIELLVVIAIIGILSSVVLASLNTARSRGTDAKIQSELRSLSVNAELYYDTNNSYRTSGSTVSGCSTAGTLFAATTPNIAQFVTSISGSSGSLTCNVAANGSAYAASARLVSNTAQYFCVDSTGKASITTSALGSTATVCP